MKQKTITPPPPQISFLGKGTFGTVFSMLIKNKKFVLKISNTNDNASLKHEYTILQLLNKVNIGPRVYGLMLCKHSKSHILIMEYVGDKHLLNILESPNYTDIFKIQIFIYLGEMLQKLHEQGGIIHNDLNPRNIIVNTENNTVTIIDYGYACFPYQSLYLEEKSAKFCYWIAPEVKRGDMITKKSDIYSYGKLLQQLAIYYIKDDRYKNDIMIIACGLLFYNQEERSNLDFALQELKRIIQNKYPPIKLNSL